MGRKPYAERKGLKVLKGGKGGTGKKRGRPPKSKGTGAHGALGYTPKVKVKLDPECGLSEAGRMVVERHVEEFLQKQLKGVFDVKRSHTTSHAVVAAGSDAD